MFVADEKRGRKFDDEPQVQNIEKILAENGVTCVTKVITVSSLIKDYQSFEAKRRLFSQYDVFIVDHVVSRLVGKKLSSIFMDSVKFPITIQDFTKKSFDKALSTVSFKVIPDGHNTAIFVGNDTMSAKILSENLYAIIDGLKTQYPGGWTNIRGISLTCTGNGFQTSYPIYHNFGNRNLVPVPTVQTQKDHEIEKHVKSLEIEGGIHITKSGKLSLDSKLIKAIPKNKFKGNKRPATNETSDSTDKTAAAVAAIAPVLPKKVKKEEPVAKSVVAQNGNEKKGKKNKNKNKKN